MRWRLNGRRLLGLTMLAGATLAGAWLANAQQRARDPQPSPHWRQVFARPTFVPFPDDNPPTPEKIELGARLFREARLSAHGAISCESCHIAALGLTDGVPRSTAGATGVALNRNTPALWNLAWAPVLFWDGRASSLEQQAAGPMSHPDEMASSPEAAARQLAFDEDYRKLFAAAFPDRPAPTAELIVKALAAYERTLVSPPTRFDRWLAGDANALSAEELRGFALFTGKGRCSSCHSGFAFTDYSFHDIGLPDSDRGRGPIADLAAAEHAFKTPSLRELVWTAPYMHDGSLATLDEVIRHYEKGGIRRPSRSRDMPPPFRLSATERSDLVAFLESLSSDRAPKPSSEPWINGARRPAAAREPGVDGTAVNQRNKTFQPGAIRLKAGQTLTIHNDDTRVHNVTISDPRMATNSGAQEPGESVDITFERTGQFEAYCGIHPTMRLRVDVE